MPPHAGVECPRMHAEVDQMESVLIVGFRIIVCHSIVQVNNYIINLYEQH